MSELHVIGELRSDNVMANLLSMITVWLFGTAMAWPRCIDNH
jgi:hypothetical protein